MRSCRCSRTSLCSFVNSARVGGPSGALSCAHPGTTSVVRARPTRSPATIGLRFLMLMPRLSFDQHEGRREDVVPNLGDAAVLPVVQVLGLEDDAIREVDV